MDIPYGIHLNVLNDPRWKALPEGYNITYQPSGKGYNVYLAWNDHIDQSCKHFSRMVNSAFIAKEYRTYQAAQNAIIEHCQGCTKAFFPNGEVNVIILPMSL